MKEELLQQYVEGNITDEEAAEVVAWLDADEANVREYMALHKLYNIALVNNKAASQAPVTAMERTKLRRLGIELGKVAAVALAVIGIGHLFNTWNSSAEKPVAWQTLYVPAGQRAQIKLADNTVVWVNAKSTLTYPVGFGRDRREVKLDGEAFFDVQADPEHPFHVKTPMMNVVVTGTEFNVSSYSDSEIFSIALLKGVVSLQSVGDGSEVYRMKPNDQIRFSDNQLHVSTIKDPDYFRWREGLICFNNETVGDIIKKLELYYDIRIDVQRTDLPQHRYTGKFRTKDGIEQVLKTLQLEHDFRFVKDSEKNRITIK